MTKLEEVAQAIGRTTGDFGDGSGWLGPNTHEIGLRKARAALEEMQNPGDIAMAAGVADYLNQERNDFKRTPWNGRRMFRVMMQAILSEDEKVVP